MVDSPCVPSRPPFFIGVILRFFPLRAELFRPQRLTASSDSVNKGTDIRFGFTNIGFIADVSNGVDGIINLRMENSLVSPKQPDESILNGNGHYPIIPNLPDMTQLDFYCRIGGFVLRGGKSVRNRIKYSTKDWHTGN